MAENESAGGLSGARPDEYDAYEPFHPGYKIMHNNVLKHVRKSMPEGADEIVDIGPGTGIVTRKLQKSIEKWRRDKAPCFRKIKTISAVEPAPEIAEYLRDRIDRAATDKIVIHTQGAIDFLKEANADPERKIGSLYSTFTEHHIQPKDKAETLKLIAENLRTGAALVEKNEMGDRKTEGPAYIIGDEFLEPHEEWNPKQRVKALVSYHGDVIEQALRRGSVMLPRLELGALISGLNNVVPFLQQMEKINGLEHGYDYSVTARPFTDSNREGVEAMTGLIERIEKIYENYQNGNTKAIGEQFKPCSEPSKHDPKRQKRMSKEEYEECFVKLIDELKEVKTNLEKSTRAGLEHNEEAEKYGDYKMTVNQFVGFLHKAGMQVQGYFMGPGHYGWGSGFTAPMFDTPPSIQKMSIGFTDNSRGFKESNHGMGGVWVLKAMAIHFDKAADKMINQVWGPSSGALCPM